MDAATPRVPPSMLPALNYTRCYAGLPRFYGVYSRLGDGRDDQPHTATEYNKSRKHVEVLIPHRDAGEDDHCDGNEYHADNGGPAQSKAVCKPGAEGREKQNREKRDVHKFKSLFKSQLTPHLFYDSFPSLNRQTHSGLGNADFPCKA